MEEEAMKSHQEELEELIEGVYLDMEMKPVEDLDLEDLKDGLMRLDEWIKKCCTMNGKLGRKYTLILDPSVKAELDNKVDQLKADAKAYLKRCREKRNSFPSAVVSQQGDQMAKQMQTQMLTLYDRLRTICQQLHGDIIPDNEGIWEESEDDDIRKAMVDKERWVKRMTQASDEFSNYKATVTVWANDELNSSGSNYLDIYDYIQDTKVSVDSAIATVVAEDKRRGLYSLQKAPVSLMEYPKFAGLDSQCFLQFEEKMKRCLKSNKVPLIDQVPKLREFLTGHALSMVPESVKLIEVAFETLRSRYGDEERVVKLKIRELKRTGLKPDKHREQVIWYTDLEGKIQQLLELGSRSGALGRFAFGPDVFEVISNLFPVREHLKLTRLKGEKYSEERLQNFRTQIALFRDDANTMDKERTDPGGGKKYGGGAGLGGGAPKVHYQNQQQLQKVVDCRFCKQLEKVGGHKGLYENHANKFYWGCPKFVEVDMKVRRETCYSARLCSTCLDMEVVFSPDHGKICKVKLEYANSGKKPKFMCKGDGPKCLWNVWVCQRHRLDNKEILKELSDQMQKKGLVMGHPSVVLLKKKAAGAGSGLGVTGLQAAGQETNKVQVEERDKVDKLFTMAQEQGVEVVAEPKGRPIFMFFAVQGKNKPVLTFFDNGCSDAVVREGIPGVEWDGVITKRGPFGMGGVGGLSTHTKDEWMVLVPRVDDKKQAVRCHSMNKVTCDFPMYDISKAVKEVKDDAPENKILQECKLPSMVGGEVDCLMGIKYSLLHPEPIHTLVRSGLSIYASKLKSHDGETNAMIGGSHESFEFFANMAGGVTQLMANFTAGLKRFREGFMPRIASNPVSFEEGEHAKHSNLAFGEFAEVNLEELMDDEGLFEEYGPRDDNTEVIDCAGCGEEFTLIEADLGDEDDIIGGTEVGDRNYQADNSHEVTQPPAQVKGGGGQVATRHTRPPERVGDPPHLPHHDREAEGGQAGGHRHHDGARCARADCGQCVYLCYSPLL